MPWDRIQDEERRSDQAEAGGEEYGAGGTEDGDAGDGEERTEDEDELLSARVQAERSFQLQPRAHQARP